MNLPNLLTLSRIPLMLVVIALIYPPSDTTWPWIRTCALLIFLFAALTDWLDGWWARRYNLVTKLGKILDPIADKVITLSCFVVLSDFCFPQMYSVWWIVPIFLREVVITIYRLAFLLRQKPIVVAASWSVSPPPIITCVALPVICTRTSRGLSASSASAMDVTSRLAGGRSWVPSGTKKKRL